MLEKNINKSCLFKDTNFKSDRTNNKFDFSFKANKVMKKESLDCIYCKCKNDEIKILKKQKQKIREEILTKDKKIKELEKYINDFINFSEKYNINNINELKKFIINKSQFINDDLIYIDFDIFQYEYSFELKQQLNDYEEQINDYESQLDKLNDIFNNNNIKSLYELKKRISKLSLNDKYHNINMLLDDLNIKSKSQNNKFNDSLNDYINFDNKIKKVKNKISNLKDGTIITIKGVKKIYRNKIEKQNIFKMIEKEVDEYIESQISWAKSIIGNSHDEKKIVYLLDILNKLNKDYNSTKSDSENEISDIFDEMENIEIKRYNALFKLGKSFINNNITDKSQIPEIIQNYKKIIYSYDSKDKINRFISTSKRMYKLSNLISTENIIKSKCMTSIRDISNKDFDILLILLENRNNVTQA